MTVDFTTPLEGEGDVNFIVKKKLWMNQSIRIFPTPQALAESLALDLVRQIREASTSD